MKKKWTYGLLMAGVLAAAVAAQQLASGSSQGIFYRISGGKNEMFLLGSIHAGSREMYPMSLAIRNAIQNADTMVYECDTASPEAQQTTAQMMKSEQPLSERIAPECYNKLEQAAVKLGYSMASFEQLEPWAVTSTLTLAAAAQEMESGSGKAASALGVENMVRRQANGKRVQYLETVQEQLGLMESFSADLQEYLLDSACQAVLEPENVSGSDADVERWPGWWKEGNAQAFADSYLLGLTKETDPELAREYHHALMTVRNRSMARLLQAMLENDEPHSYFVTVGLMHLVLPGDSVIAELEAMGYQIEQIKE